MCSPRRLRQEKNKIKSVEIVPRRHEGSKVPAGRSRIFLAPITTVSRTGQKRFYLCGGGAVVVYTRGVQTNSDVCVCVYVRLNFYNAPPTRGSETFADSGFHVSPLPPPCSISNYIPRPRRHVLVQTKPTPSSFVTIDNANFAILPSSCRLSVLVRLYTRHGRVFVSFFSSPPFLAAGLSARDRYKHLAEAVPRARRRDAPAVYGVRTSIFARVRSG